ncbi:DUF937 domain-containing protein [Methylobacterium nigriterrae]|uniref:DUF937 domain-containing protein n=1 Tax=Methylobacterium nigriterrae TaxID=3127512 RepID=UPI003013F53F
MFNPIDILQAQSSAGMQGMAQQFGLTPDQTRRALEALMPAFALGFQRNAAQDPTGLSQFFGFGAAPRAAAGDAPFAMPGGLFGSPMLAQAVIQQAAAASGVGSQVLRQMLPIMAGMIVASVVHMLLNQSASDPAPPRQPAEPANPYGNPSALWTEMMRAFLPPQAEAPVPAAPPPARPKPPADTRAAPAPLPAPQGDAAPETAPLDMFQQMLQTGAEVQEQNVKAMQGIFDAFWSEAGKDAPKPAKAPGRTSAGSPGKALGNTPGNALGKAPGKALGKAPARTSAKAPARKPPAARRAPAKDTGPKSG